MKELKSERRPVTSRAFFLRTQRGYETRGNAVLQGEIGRAALTRNQRNEVVQRLTAKLIVPRRV
jgi:hypothetical protein